MNADSPHLPPPRKIPVYPLSEYVPKGVPEPPFFIGRFEETTRLEPKRLRLHRHTFHEVFFLNGRGRFFCDFYEHSIVSPTLIFVSPGQVHAWSPEPKLSGPLAGFTRAFYDGAEPPPSALLRLPFWFSCGVSCVLAVPRGEVASMDSLWRDLAREAAGVDEIREEMSRLRLRLILLTAARIYRRSLRNTPVTSRPAEALVHGFRLALEAHFSERRPVSAYARMLKVSASHLSECVLQRTGQSAGELIRDRLLLESRRLLAHSSQNVAEIANSLGFEDPSYFSRFFKRGAGTSPGDFRRRFREKYQD